MRFNPGVNQRGRGLGKIIKSGFQLLKRFLFPSLAKVAQSSVGKTLANQAGSVLSGIAADAISGKKASRNQEKTD